jgi:hypothetical protein
MFNSAKKRMRTSTTPQDVVCVAHAENPGYREGTVVLTMTIDATGTYAEVFVYRADRPAPESRRALSSGDADGCPGG